LILSYAGQGTSQQASIMPWFCLERCNNATVAQIETELANIVQSAQYISAASFEMYNLGPGSTLVVNNFTRITSALQEAGIETWPMVSSYPYPPQFLDWMREVFVNPQPFIDACISEAKLFKYTGFNIDWEPTATASDQDAQDYAAFLTTFSNAMHSVGLQVSVDTATWNTIWNYSYLAASTVDQIITMQTYTGPNDQWLQVFVNALAQLPADKLVIGLETLNPTTGRNLTDADLAMRFSVLQALGVHKIGIWDIPLPPNWWPYLEQFASYTST